jgi:hypothetical protein
MERRFSFRLALALAKTDVYLAISLANAVHGLGVREVIAVRGLELVDQTGPRKRGIAQIRLGGLYRLAVPVGVSVVNAPNRIGIWEAVAVRWSSPVSVDTGSLGRSRGVVDSLVVGW